MEDLKKNFPFYFRDREFNKNVLAISSFSQCIRLGESHRNKIKLLSLYKFFESLVLEKGSSKALKNI